MKDPPPFTAAAAHAFVFGWQHQMEFQVDFGLEKEQPATARRLIAAVDAWKKAQPGAPAHQIVIRT